MKFYIDKNAEVLHEDVLINVALWCYDDTIEEIWEEYNLDKDFGLVEEAYKREDIHVNLYGLVHYKVTDFQRLDQFYLVK